MTIFIYISICFGFVLSQDDENKWDVYDYITFLLSPIFFPFLIGSWIGDIYKNYFNK